MSIFMTFRIAVKALNRNKLRTTLTMLGMIIGVGAVITMVALGNGAQVSIEQQIQSAGTNVIMINAGNFNTLEVAWRFKTDSLGPRPEFKLEGTPLMVGGMLYATSGTRRAVVALDAKTGELIWSHSMREGKRAAVAPRPSPNADRASPLNSRTMQSSHFTVAFVAAVLLSLMRSLLLLT